MTEKKTQVFTDEERAAMKNRSEELKAEARGATGDAESEFLAKIADMDEPDRTLAERIHAIVTTAAPELTPKLWYGMPGYAKDGKVLCFFQPAKKFKSRYATFGFNENAKLDDGRLWPTAFAVTELTAAEEKQLAELVRSAVS